MQLRGITTEDFRASVERVNALPAYAGNLAVDSNTSTKGVRKFTTTGRLTVVSSRAPGARTSSTGRHIKAACWHAFRDVVRDILANHPDAVITTSLARYDAATFEDTYPSTGDTNVGSMVQPAYMPELCTGACAGDFE